VEEVGGMIVSSSDARHEVASKLPGPFSIHQVIDFLGDQSHPEFTVFRESGPDDYVKTVAVGKSFFYDGIWHHFRNDSPITDPGAGPLCWCRLGTGRIFWKYLRM
jgi:hypothetical protein